MADVKKITLTKKPIEVRTDWHGQVYFVTIWKNGSLQVRPKGARKSEAIAITSVDSVYQRALLIRARDAKPARRRRTVKRGVLSLERGGF